ncbi:hypothetical protein T36_0463 [Helicobacter cinaedi]|uniref:hypothetical protein n=1 Tax=Helicobacter cinaedi TaxID=213 RepID=UPI001F41E828|nr:hypothetical protein [Helicobacter cinaedi]BDB64016.1 hypothetical protein T36_0463 [Helicobacter cinaedi]
MRILKILYIIWIVFWAIGFAIFTPIVHNLNFSVFLEILFGFVLLCLFPLLPYFYYLIYEKANSAKNIFVIAGCYLSLFAIICCYCLPLFLIKDNIYFILAIIMHTSIFIIIYRDKRSLNETSSQ